MSASRLFRILASRFPLVALAAGAGAALGLASALWHAPVHEAQVLARVAASTGEPRGSAQPGSATDVARLLASERMLRQVSTELQLAGDPGLRTLRERSGDAAIPAELWLVGWLRQGLVIEATEGSPTVRLRFRAADAALTARIIHALVNAPATTAQGRETPAPLPTASLALQRHLVDATDRLARARLEAEIAMAEPAPPPAVRGRAPAVPDPARAAAARNHREELSALQRALEQAQRALEELPRSATAQAAADPRASLVVLTSVIPPGAGTQDAAWLRTVIGLLAGLFAGVLAALLVERLRQPVRDAADLVQAAGVPVLGVLGGADATEPPRSAGFVAPPLPEPPVLTRIVPRAARGAGSA